MTLVKTWLERVARLEFERLVIAIIVAFFDFAISAISTIMLVVPELEIMIATSFSVMQKAELICISGVTFTIVFIPHWLN